MKRLEAVERDLQRELNRQEKAQAGQAQAAVLASLTRVITALEQERDQLRCALDEHFQQHSPL